MGTGQRSDILKDVMDCVFITTEANGTVVMSRDVAMSTPVGHHVAACLK